MAKAVSALVHDVCMIQALGDYDASKAFLDKYAVLSIEVDTLNQKMSAIPTDIRPHYPKI